MDVPQEAVMELIKVIVLGPVTILLALYTYRLHRELRGVEKERVNEVKIAETKRVSDLQATQQKMEALIEKFYRLMMKQGDTLEAFDGTIRDQAQQFAELRDKVLLLLDRRAR